MGIDFFMKIFDLNFFFCDFMYYFMNVWFDFGNFVLSIFDLEFNWNIVVNVVVKFR